MKSAKHYLGTLLVGAEITSPAIDKVLTAMEQYAQDTWDEACRKVELEGDMPTDYIRPNFKPNKFNDDACND